MRIIRLQVDTEIQDKKGDKRSDLELVAAMNGGDAVAFEVLIRKWWKPSKRKLTRPV